MKLGFLLGAAAGYVLGTRAGRERYEEIVQLARRVSGSQTVQSSAGMLQAQIDELATRTKGAVNSALHNDGSDSSSQRLP